MSVQSGRDGEAFAEQFLTGKGWRILARNWRSAGAEVDLVGRDGETLVFVEVKLRTSNTFGTAAAAVGRVKQRKIIRASIGYIRKISHDGPIRFDVIAIDGKVVNHIPDAFRAEGYTL